MGALTAPEVRAAEGWAPMAIDTAHSFDPVNDPEAGEAQSAATVVEVPA
jgi:hypothetical protein